MKVSPKTGQFKKRQICNFKVISRFTQSRIIKALKEQESGREVKDFCRELGINRATFFAWKKKYEGMEIRELKRLKELEGINTETSGG